MNRVVLSEHQIPPHDSQHRIETGEEVSDTDAQAFLNALNEEGLATEAELQRQYDKNFQTLSYHFMKRIFSHVESEIKRRQ